MKNSLREHHTDKDFGPLFSGELLRDEALEQVSEHNGKWMELCVKEVEQNLTRDHDGLNNQRANLRIADARGNAGNSRKNKNGLTSKFRGVSWARHANKFVASLTKRGQRHHLGYFISEEAAARAYDKAAAQYFGEFANLNLPPVESANVVAFATA